MDVSKFLAKALGLYWFIVGLAMMLNMQEFIMNLNGLINDPPLLFLSGFIILILGILAVLSHTIWQWNWRLIITLYAWFTLFRGAILIGYPYFSNKATLILIENYTVSYFDAVLDCVLGLMLCYFGFRKDK